MRDELETLLEEAEVPGEETPQVLEPPRVAVWKRRGETAWAEEESSARVAAAALAGEGRRSAEEAARLVPWRRKAVSEERREDEAESVAGASEAEAVREPTEAALEPLRVRGTVLTGVELSGSAARAAQGLYQALEKGRRAAGYRPGSVGGGVRLVRERGSASLPAAADAKELDRQFQRDARRYDGGFTWQ